VKGGIDEKKEKRKKGEKVRGKEKKEEMGMGM
jgi:hypothetical protein